MPEVLRVAVADDEPVMQMYLEETVSMLGHEVVAVAKNGVELVALCMQTLPDLIVTDIRMPQCDGYEAIRRIGQEQTLPVVFVSGFDEASRVDSATTYCVANYLTKPVDEEQLNAGIQTVLARFERFRLLLAESIDHVDALARLKGVQRALEHLWRHQGLMEADAFHYLQKTATANSLSLSGAADHILADGAAI
ncbi:MAG: response regulator [FCB group bacterium]|jgi:AmiR/NasT family two-component response regulator|nr:response regulator [FCB group bacterium]